jgi:hypothetical protein
MTTLLKSMLLRSPLLMARVLRSALLTSAQLSALPRSALPRSALLRSVLLSALPMKLSYPILNQRSILGVWRDQRRTGRKIPELFGMSFWLLKSFPRIITRTNSDSDHELHLKGKACQEGRTSRVQNSICK